MKSNGSYMRNIPVYTRVLSLSVLLTGILFSSCTGRLPDAESGSADVLLRIGLPGGGISAEEGPWTKTDGNATEDEMALHSLRVIVSTGAKTIIDNHFFKEEEFTFSNLDGQPNVVLTIPKVPYGTVSFYVIANEESLWGTEYYTDENLLAALETSTKIVYKEQDAANRHFPRRGSQIAEYGLPMTGSSTLQQINSEMQSVSVNLVRSVVKIAFDVENRTQSTIELNSVRFGKFFGDRYYMFRDYNLDVPDDIQYYDFEYTKGSDEEPIATISSGSKTNKMYLYLYPTHAATSPNELSPYTMELETDVRTYPAQVFTQSTYFIRNTQVSISAVITSTGLTLEYEVGDWNIMYGNIPDFE